MQLVTITQTAQPLYNELGHVIGFESVQSDKYKVTRKQLDEILSVENDGVLVHLVNPTRKNRRKN